MSKKNKVLHCINAVAFVTMIVAGCSVGNGNALPWVVLAACVVWFEIFFKANN